MSMVCVECVWSLTRLFCVNTYQSTPPPLFTLYYQSMNQRMVVPWAFLSSHTHSIQSKHTNAVCIQQNRRVVAMVRAEAKNPPKLLNYPNYSILISVLPSTSRPSLFVCCTCNIATAAPPQRNSLVVLLIPSFLSKLKNVLVCWCGTSTIKSSHQHQQQQSTQPHTRTITMP